MKRTHQLVCSFTSSALLTLSAGAGALNFVGLEAAQAQPGDLPLAAEEGQIQGAKEAVLAVVPRESDNLAPVSLAEIQSQLPTIDPAAVREAVDGLVATHILVKQEDGYLVRVTRKT
jgi:hypothetical protein